MGAPALERGYLAGVAQLGPSSGPTRAAFVELGLASNPNSTEADGCAGWPARGRGGMAGSLGALGGGGMRGMAGG